MQMPSGDAATQCSGQSKPSTLPLQMLAGSGSRVPQPTAGAARTWPQNCSHVALSPMGTATLRFGLASLTETNTRRDASWGGGEGAAKESSGGGRAAGTGGEAATDPAAVSSHQTPHQHASLPTMSVCVTPSPLELGAAAIAAGCSRWAANRVWQTADVGWRPSKAPNEPWLAGECASCRHQPIASAPG